MNYYHATIRLNEVGAGTIAIMEWIRDNECPNLDCTIFNDARGNYVAMVSKGDESMFREFLEDMDRGESSWFEYEGMRRCQSRFVQNLWIFLIYDNCYWATI